MLCYEQPLYRPPSEADNLILQVTIGCRYNQCSFCSMYKHKTYRLKTLEEIEQDIELLRRQQPDARRVFLADGDAFNLPAEELLPILELLQTALPRLSRVSAYATPANISSKTADELVLLKQNKLSLLYVGIESGDNRLLKIIQKGASRNSIKKSLLMAANAGIKVSATVILGLGGRSHSKEHIEQTVELLNLAPVSYLSTLQLFLERNTEDEFYSGFDTEFIPQNDMEILDELQQLITGLNPPSPVIFRSNHASNTLALAGNLPRDRELLIDEINVARKSLYKLRDRNLRHL